MTVLPRRLSLRGNTRIVPQASIGDLRRSRRGEYAAKPRQRGGESLNSRCSYIFGLYYKHALQALALPCIGS